MALIAHFDLELHQMDMKITFLNKDLKSETDILSVVYLLKGLYFIIY
jgi:hypothetical protein